MTDQTRWWLVGTGAFMAIGAFLPWVQAGIISLAGTSGDGVFVLVGGVIVAIVGLSKKATALTGIGVIVIAAFCLYIVYNVFSGMSDLTTDDGGLFTPSIGSGLLLSGFASLMALIAGFKTFGEREKPAPTRTLPDPAPMPPFEGSPPPKPTDPPAADPPASEPPPPSSTA
jgi:hypothetical protein